MRRRRERYRSLVVCILACVALVCCSVRSQKPFVIGIIIDLQVNADVFDGFKAGLAAQGYAEGSKVAYVFNGCTGREPETVEKELARVMERKPDAILALGAESIRTSGRVLSGKETPVILTFLDDESIEKFVGNLRRPVGNMTGVRMAPDNAKLMEWLMTIAPSTKRVFLPYQPNSPVFDKLIDLPALARTAPLFGVELLVRDAATTEAMVKEMASLPDRTAMLVVVPLEDISDVSVKATQWRIPIFSIYPRHLDQGALFSLYIDHDLAGRQAARQMGMVLHGIPPSDIPVETAESVSAINLKAAAAMGLNVPDDVLAQVNRIVR